jgi:hypothetical protein
MAGEVMLCRARGGPEVTSHQPLPPILSGEIMLGTYGRRLHFGRITKFEVFFTSLRRSITRRVHMKIFVM